MSPQLEHIIFKLKSFKVPEEWSQIYPSLKPLDSWIRDLGERVNQIRSWICNGSPPIIWLSGFTFPSGFLTSVLQTTARERGSAIDSLSWEFHTMENDLDFKDKPRNYGNGIYVSGLVLEGARWDSTNDHLTEPFPMKLQSKMPVIHFKPTEMKQRNPQELYECPLYTYPVRSGTFQHSSFVMSVNLNKGQMSCDHWTKRGVALLLSTGE